MIARIRLSSARFLPTLDILDFSLELYLNLRIFLFVKRLTSAHPPLGDATRI